MIEVVLAAFRAVGDINVRPAVFVEVGDGHGRPHRGDLRHDGCQDRVEDGGLVREVNPALVGDLLQREAVAPERVGACDPPGAAGVRRDVPVHPGDRAK